MAHEPLLSINLARLVKTNILNFINNLLLIMLFAVSLNQAMVKQACLIGGDI